MAGQNDWAGILDELAISARALSDDHIRTQWHNYWEPTSFYSMGSPNRASQANRSPVLRPTFAGGKVGDTIDTNLVLRSTDPDGHTVVLDTLTGSGGGAASVQGGNTARFVPTVEGRWQRDATVKDNQTPAKTSKAPIIWDITAGSIIVANRPKRPPTTGAVKNATPSTLNTVYLNASSGDQIILDTTKGAYGAFNANRDFSDTAPVIIRPAEGSLWGAVFNDTIRLTGKNHWLHEIKTQQPNTASSQLGVSLEDNRQWLTRCWFNNANGVHSSTGVNRSYIWIGWNRFTGQNNLGSTRDQIYFNLPGEGNWTTDASGPNHVYIYGNFFWDDLASGPEDHCVYFGDTKASVLDVPMMWEVYFEDNFWHLLCKRNRILYLKRGPTEAMYNQCDAHGHNWGVRHGMGSKWWGNRSACDMMMMSGVRDSRTSGTDLSHSYPNGGPWPNAAVGQHHDIRGNYMTSGSIKLFAGTYANTPWDPKTAGPYAQAAHCALLVGNIVSGNIEIGYKQSTPTHAREGGATDNVKVYLAGKIPSSKVIYGYAGSNNVVIPGDGGYAYPGDGVTRDIADYAANGSNQGAEIAGQASAT